MEFHIYKDTRSEYRWYLKASNGRKIADSAEGYNNKDDAEAMINKIKGYASIATVVDETVSRVYRY